MAEKAKIERYRRALRDQETPGKDERAAPAKEAEGEAATLGREIHETERAGKPRALTGDTAIPFKPRPLRERRRTQH